MVTHAPSTGLSLAAADARKGLEVIPRAHIETSGGDVERAALRDTMTKEATMYKIMATPAAWLDDVVESHRSHHNDTTGNPTDTAAAQLTIIAPGYLSCRCGATDAIRPHRPTKRPAWP